MKKLALLLALCLAVTMLPGFGYCEDDDLNGGVDIQIEGLSGDVEARVELPADQPLDSLTIEGELTLDLTDSADALSGADGQIAEIRSANEEADQLESADAQEADDGSTPHVDPDGPRLEPNALTLGIGEQFALNVTMPEGTGGAISFSSSDATVAEVSAEGVVTAIEAGFACIRADAENGTYSECFVDVKSAPDKIALSVDKKRLGVGERGRVSFALPKDTAGAVTFSSKDPAVVSVDAATGEIVTVSVGAAPTALSFPADKVKLGLGMKQPLSASMDEGAAGEVVYSIKNKKVVTYKDGMIKGVRKGKAVLTATAYNGLSAKCTVEVVDAPEKVSFPYKALDIGVKQSVRLQPDVGDSASTFTYSTSNKKIVKVAADGTITGVKKGSATITVKTYNDKKCKLKVNVVKAPSSVKLSPESLELSVGETAELTWSFPKGTAAGVAFESSDPAVASVDPETGVVTGVSGGEAVITVTTTNGKTDQTSVKVLPPVEWVAFTEPLVEIGVGQKHLLTVEMNPGASSPLKFKSADKAVATVTKGGVVKGVAEGETTVSVSTNVEGVTAETTVRVLPAPDSVKFDVDALTLNVGETLLLMPVIPEGTATGFTYSSSDPAIATVTEDGTLTAIAYGEATITVTTSNGMQAELAVKVEDPLYPTSARLTNAPSKMKVGETLQLTWEVEPAGANVDFKWETSNADIAYADEASVLYAVDIGYATITATSRTNPEIVLNFQVAVESDDVTLTIPERITGTSGIGGNLEKIDAIRASAIGQIDALKSNGKITSSDADKRKRIVNNAFRDYAFPWMTLKKQKYWKEKYDEGGAKDFKPDRVYYGVPYTQDGRAYNVDLLLDGNYYYDSSEGYYILNQDKIDGRKYRGSDCSSFVDAAIWGTNSDHSDDRTSDINKTSAYKTIKEYDSLRTGDLICKSHAHVVMFLYFVNAEKTKMMIIENGGIEPGTNTVHCMVMNVSWYKSRSYKIRRLKSLG